MSKYLRQIEIGHNLQNFLNLIPSDKKSDFQYTQHFWNLDGYTFDGLTVAIDFEYTDDEYPTPTPVYLLSSSRRDPNPSVIPFGAETPLDSMARLAITGYFAIHRGQAATAVRS